MEDIWRLCNGPAHLAPLETKPFRIVESQEQVATNRLVDSAEELQLLEALLEGSKPPMPAGSEQRHYLINTPFRYPPLPYGSRFGTRWRRGIFYASIVLPTALAECAYYRFLFWHGMAEPPPRGRLETEHTSFTVWVRTPRAIRLERSPFARYRDRIAHPADYGTAQRLGEAMREEGVEAFTYPSARDPDGGVNLAAFHPSAIVEEPPQEVALWLCTTRADVVSFVALHSRDTSHSFPLSLFLHEEHFPQPACG